jgi:hypothetical protein
MKDIRPCLGTPVYMLGEIVCPRCHDQILGDADALRCAACQARFPMCDENLPVLIAADPDMAIAGAYNWLLGKIGTFDEKIHKLNLETWRPEDWEKNRVRLLEAYGHNLTVLETMESRLRPRVPPRKLIRAIKDTSSHSEYWDF